MAKENRDTTGRTTKAKPPLKSETPFQKFERLAKKVVSAPKDKVKRS